MTFALTKDTELRTIEREVVARHRCVLRELTIVRVDGGVVLRGRSVCHYGKQVAFHEVKKLIEEPVIGNRIEVEDRV